MIGSLAFDGRTIVSSISVEEFHQKDRAYIAESMKIRFFPILLESSQGCWIRDTDGKEYLDFSASWAVANTGYGHPQVVEAVHNQVRKTTTNSHISIPSPVTIELAEKLIGAMAGDFAERVWFGHSGSEAGDLVAKFLPIAKQRPKIVSFEGSYHGQTLGAAALSGHTSSERFFGSASMTKVPYPNPYRYDGDERACCEEHLKIIRRLLERSAQEYAGLVVEPIMSDGGVIVPPDGFLEGLEVLCREYDLYYVIDEVKTGFGRSGKLFAFQHARVQPDAVMLGKPIASGIPLSAVVGRAEILNAVPSGHMMTTAGNPVACAAGLATLAVIQQEGLAERAERLGVVLKEALNALGERYPQIGDVRGKGLILGVELIEPDTGEPNPTLTAQLCFRAKQLGLILFYVGTSSNVVEITPPLVISEGEIARGIELFEQALADSLAGRVSEAELADYVGW
jgi:4-aminobutyrate aminotransferase